MTSSRLVLGAHNKLLEIDLTKKTYTTVHISKEERKLYLGGKGLAIYYLYKKMDLSCDPLGEDNIIAIFGGVMVGTGAPNSSRFAAVTKSPLTGLIISSSCGGSFAFFLKSVGYDGVIIKGRAKEPTYLSITENGVSFNSASEIWGKDIFETQELLEAKNKGNLVIGPAGENRVLYANVASGHRFFGRGGIGAVFGAKNLKAIIVEKGLYRIKPKREKKYKKIKKKAIKYLNRNEYTSDLYRNYGTNAGFRICNEKKILPVRNFTKGMSEKAIELYGERLKSEFYKKYSSCRNCAILCGHKGMFNGKLIQAPEYETTSLFGSNLEIYDAEKIAEWNEICSRLGLDTISTSVTLAYAIEANEKNLFSLPLKFGSPEGISEILYDIAYKRGIGEELALGTKRLAEKYGGKEFAMHIKGLEFSGYDPRGCWGQGLSYSVANRGACHLSASLFTLEAFFSFLKGESKRAKAQFVYYMENLFSAINSLQLCIFTSYAFMLEAPIAKYPPKIFLKIFIRYFPRITQKVLDISIYSKLFETVTGIKQSSRDFLKAGERIHILERYMNTLIGVSRIDDTLPERFLNEGRESDKKKKVVPLEEMLEKYYKVRGYSRNGVPTAKAMKKLGIEEGFQPKPKRIKERIVALVFTILGRAMKTLSTIDSNIKQEIRTWPTNFKILFNVDNYETSLGLLKNKKGVLNPQKVTEKQADLVITFKTIDAAFELMTAQKGIHHAYASNAIKVKGDTQIAMSLIRCLNITETYLFPRIIAKRIMRKIPTINLMKRYIVRMYLYLFSIPFNI
ncbi:MAG: aldehyde ferredoxin oxidoreductase C-terminal domain-containing protein [Candidatus Heimdallarchaeaceae archaeon]